jgi:hypothetical protein
VSQQCDANDYYDSDKFMGKMMERDLRQMLFRRRFTRLLPENILEVRLGQPNPNPSPHRLRASTHRRHQPQNSILPPLHKVCADHASRLRSKL